MPLFIKKKNGLADSEPAEKKKGIKDSENSEFISNTIKSEIKKGHPQKQAIAIAYSKAGKTKKKTKKK